MSTVRETSVTECCVFFIFKIKDFFPPLSIPGIVHAQLLSPPSQGNKTYVYPVDQRVSHCWSHTNFSTHGQFYPELMAGQNLHETQGLGEEEKRNSISSTKEELDTRESRAGHEASLVVKWPGVFLILHPTCLAGTSLFSQPSPMM